MEEWYDHVTVDECLGCDHITLGNECSKYSYPQPKWSSGNKCPLATNLEKKVAKEVFIDPIKLSKMKMKGKK